MGEIQYKISPPNVAERCEFRKNMFSVSRALCNGVNYFFFRVFHSFVRAQRNSVREMSIKIHLVVSKSLEFSVNFSLYLSHLLSHLGTLRH